MKVLFIGPYKSAEFYLKYHDASDPGLGGQRKMESVLRALLMGGHQVRVVSSAVAAKGGKGVQSVAEHRQFFPEGFVDVVHAKTLRAKSISGLGVCFTGPLLVLSECRRFLPDIIFSYNGAFAEAIGGACAHWNSGAPVILEIDDLPSVRRSRVHPKAMLDAAAWPLVRKIASAFVQVNSELLPENQLRDTPCLLLPGVIDSRLSALSSERVRPFGKSNYALLYAGALADYRNVDKLLQAVPLLPACWKLMLAGSGPLTDACIQVAMRWPSKCEFLGLLSPEDLYRKLCSVDAVVNTPEQLRCHHGVFPFKILEYIISRAHLISGPLPKLEGLNLRWCQSWNGSPVGLVERLNNAPTDYAAAEHERNASIVEIEKRYHMKSVSGDLDNLLKATYALRRASD